MRRTAQYSSRNKCESDLPLMGILWASQNRKAEILPVGMCKTQSDLETTMVIFGVNLAMSLDSGIQTNTNVGVPVEVLFRFG